MQVILLFLEIRDISNQVVFFKLIGLFSPQNAQKLPEFALPRPHRWLSGVIGILEKGKGGEEEEGREGRRRMDIPV